MDAFVFTKYESARDCVLQTLEIWKNNMQIKRISEHDFLKFG